MNFLVLNTIFSLEGEFPGDWNFTSSIRGVLGRTLKRNVCLQRNIECDECTFNECLYRQLFAASDSGNTAYRPYIIYHSDTSNRIIRVNFVLFGALIDSLSLIIHNLIGMTGATIQCMGTPLKLMLLRIEDQQGRLVYSPNPEQLNIPEPSSVEWKPRACQEALIQFETPLRMKHENRIMRRFYWPGFLHMLQRRVEKMVQLYGSEEEAIPRVGDDGARWEANMRWQEFYRKSWSQDEKMSIGGLVGSVRVEHPGPETMALLKYGEILHAGKQTTFGNGKFKIWKS